MQGVLESGVLSGFYGSPGRAFGGGPKVKDFEQACATATSIACISGFVGKRQ